MVENCMSLILAQNERER